MSSRVLITRLDRLPFGVLKHRRPIKSPREFTRERKELEESLINNLYFFKQNIYLDGKILCKTKLCDKATTIKWTSLLGRRAGGRSDGPGRYRKTQANGYEIKQTTTAETSSLCVHWVSQWWSWVWKNKYWKNVFFLLKRHLKTFCVLFQTAKKKNDKKVEEE